MHVMSVYVHSGTTSRVTICRMLTFIFIDIGTTLLYNPLNGMIEAAAVLQLRVFVEKQEVVDEDRKCDRDEQEAVDGTQAANQLAPHSDRNHVAVAHLRGVNKEY